MSCFIRNRDGRRRNFGQVLLLFVVLMVVLFAFVGLGIDVGFSYITRAQLSKAVDAACLTSARNLYQGKKAAEALARSTFAANYGVSGRDHDEPDVTVKIFSDGHDNQVVNVSATVSINTFFIRALSILPGVRNWSTLAVASTAEATRNKVIMTLVLDRSGSMHDNGGELALPPAVTNFISFFNDDIDYVALVSFASTATVDVPIGHDFKTKIDTAVNNLHFADSTFSQGGLTNALVQNQIGSNKVPPDDHPLKVVVFFTDGLANMFQATLDCPSPTVLNIGGFDANDFSCASGNGARFNLPDDPTELGTKNCDPNKDYCPGTTDFLSSIDGNMKEFFRTNTTHEALFRSIRTARDMQRNGTVIYSIGLGNQISTQFLLELANDPASARYDPNYTSGQAVFAPTADDLQGVFQALATRILVRLSR